MVPVRADKYVSFLGASTHLENIRPKSGPPRTDSQWSQLEKAVIWYLFWLEEKTVEGDSEIVMRQIIKPEERASLTMTVCIHNMMNNEKKRMFRLGPLRSFCRDVGCFVLGQRNKLPGNTLLHPQSSQLSTFFSSYLIRCCFVALGRKSFI